jgi:sulfopyruvate decarboxylase TPP-binding subunit
MEKNMKCRVTRSVEGVVICAGIFLGVSMRNVIAQEVNNPAYLNP